MNFNLRLAAFATLFFSLSSIGHATVDKTPCGFELDGGKPALEAFPRFKNYFDTVRENLKERGYVVDLAELALLSEEHLLLMGPPGNAKSMIANEVFSHIVETATNEPSYYRIQMTPETTLSETHGPLNYKALTETNVYDRLYEEGMLMSRNVFLDEIFDARSNATRNTLSALNERSHSQGRHLTRGKIETAIAATNKYISEVYDKADDDGPKALIDRFAFSAFVPGDFEETESALSLVNGAKKSLKPMPYLTFDDLEAMRSLVPAVEIPEYVGKFLVLLRGKIKAETESIEQSSLAAYKEKLRNGEAPKTPPYRATKYFSPRTLGKAAGILKAIVVRDWLAEGGRRPLRATLNDLAQIEKFFTLNGPSTEFVEQLLGQSTNPHEQAQLTAIIQEREIFQRNFKKIMDEMNAVVYQYAVTDLQAQLDSTSLTPADREQLIRKMTLALLDVQEKRNMSGKLAALSGEQIGLDHVKDFLVSSLKELLGDQYEPTVARIVREAEAEQQRLLAEQKALEEERVREEKRRQELAREEAEQKEKARLEAERQALLKKQLDEARANILPSSVNDPSKFELMSVDIAKPDSNLFAVSPSSEVVLLDLASHQLKVINPAKRSVTPVAVSAEDETLKKVFAGEAPVTGMYAPDNDHVVICSGARAWTIDHRAAKVTANLKLGASDPNPKVALNRDRTGLLVIDRAQERIFVVDWRMGTASHYAIGSDVRTLKPGGPNKTLDVFSRIQDKDIVFESSDKKSIYITNDDLREIYEFSTDTITHRSTLKKPGALANASAGFGKTGENIYTYQNHCPGWACIYRTSASDSPHAYPNPHYVTLNEGTINDIAVIDNGRYALIATKDLGVILFNMHSTGIIGNHAWLSNHQADKPFQVDDTTFGYLDQDTTGWHLKVVRLKLPEGA